MSFRSPNVLITPNDAIRMMSLANLLRSGHLAIIGAEHQSAREAIEQIAQECALQFDATPSPQEP